MNCLGIDPQIKPQTGPTEVESVSDIVWELEKRGIITNPLLWISKLENDKNAYWLARKTVEFIRKGERDG